MANSAQVSKILPHLRLVGGTDFNGALGEKAIVRPIGATLSPELVERLGAVGGEKGVLDVHGMGGGWVCLDACVPFDVAMALLDTYVSARA